MPTETLTDAGAENAEVFVEELDRWLEVRTRYLTWVDGRLAQMVIASDITPRRNAEEQAALQAERAQTASRLITMGEMASSVAHELNQPLTAISNYCNGMISRVKEQRISRTNCSRAGKNGAPGPARRPDHPAHPGLREAQRAQPHAVGRGHHGEQRDRTGRHRTAAPAGAPLALRGRSACRS
jgi:signal transduction histidine kinase